MAKRYTKAELDKMPLDARIKAYNRMAEEEGAATSQQKYNPRAGSLPADINSRLSNPPYAEKYPQATGPLRGATRRVSEAEIKSQNARQRRLEAYITAHPKGTLPADWDKNGKAKGGSTKKMAKGGSASSRADGIARKGKTRGKMC